MEPAPFTIRIPDDTLVDLHERLGRVRWPDEVPGAGWQYGADLTYLRHLVEYWRTQYDWRVHEARLNAFQQFTVPLSEIELHFIHQPGLGPAPLPLLLLHGSSAAFWHWDWWRRIVGYRWVRGNDPDGIPASARRESCSGTVNLF